MNLSEPTKTAKAYEIAWKSVLTPTRYNEFISKRDLANAKAKAQYDLKVSLDKKYPLSTREIQPANGKSKQKYREIELTWFKKLAGNPDDFNNAVKEGNGKSPRGKDANYMIMKAAAGSLSAKDIGLIIRAFASAWGGDKFGLGDDGTYVVAINGTKGRIGDLATITATITANIVPITETLTTIAGLLSAISGFIPDTSGTNPSNDGSNVDASALPNPPSDGSESGNGSGGGDNTTLLLIGAALVGGFLILNK